MGNWIKRMYIKYREIILYGICGAATTFINILVFHISYGDCGISLFISNTLAWILAFIFAFISNKLWVFESRKWTGGKAVREMFGFLSARLATLLLDTFFMWFMVDGFRVNGTLSKICSNIITTVANYIISKFVVFRNVNKVDGEM